eukprot:2811184-Amphidinium_carterae.1
MEIVSGGLLLPRAKASCWKTEKRSVIPSFDDEAEINQSCSIRVYLRFVMRVFVDHCVQANGAAVPWCEVTPARVDRTIFVEFNGHHYDRLVVARLDTVKTYCQAPCSVDDTLAGGGKRVGRPVAENVARRATASGLKLSSVAATMCSYYVLC